MKAQIDECTDVLELLEMPLDILFEICKYLCPLDILSLGRTSMVTRQLVFSTEFKAIWVHARSQDPTLPECPDDMTEPAYAELMFGDSCLVCGKVCDLNGLRRIFAARERLCLDCFHLRYTLVSRDFSELRGLGLPVGVVDLLPKYSHYRSNGGCVVWADIYYSNAHLSLWLQQYSKHETAEDKQAWEDAIICKQTCLRRHADLCLYWSDRRNEEILQCRQEKLFAHMRNLGYKDEITQSKKALRQHDHHFRQMCQTSLTTEKLEALTVEIEKVMQSVKNTHLAIELEGRYEARMRELKYAYDDVLLSYPLHQPRLRVCDLLVHPRIRSIISDTHPDITVTRDHFQLSSEALVNITAEVTNIIHTKLLSFIEVGLTDKAFDPATFLSLATTVFNTDYHRPMVRSYFFAPEAITEQCISLGRRTHQSIGPDHNIEQIRDQVLYKVANKTLGGYPWDANDNITFDHNSHDALCNILAVCGLDPNSTLLSQLEDEPPVVECLECSTSDPQAGRLLMSWLWAAHHISQHHNTASFIPSQSLYHVVGHDAAEARGKFKEMVLGVYISYMNRPCRTICVHCEYLANDMGEMTSHLDACHGIKTIRHTDINYTYDPIDNFYRSHYMQECRLPPSGPDNA